jgi:hypothetical protein
MNKTFKRKADLKNVHIGTVIKRKLYDFIHECYYE